MGGARGQAGGAGALMGQKGMGYRWTWGNAPIPPYGGRKMGGARGQAGGAGTLHRAKGQGLWVNMGAKPPYPFTEGENRRRARAGGRRGDVAWGKRSRALGEHGYKAPYPLYGEAGAFAYQNKNSFHLYMACKNAGPCQHLLFGKTVFGGAGGTDKFCFSLIPALRGVHKLCQHLPSGKTVSSGAGGTKRFRRSIIRVRK